MNQEEELIIVNTTYMAESNTKKSQERGCEMYFSENGKTPQNEENVLQEWVWRVRAHAEKESKDCPEKKKQGLLQRIINYSHHLISHGTWP